MSTALEVRVAAPTRTLEELARIVRDEKLEAEKAFERSLRHAIALGTALLEAKELIGPRGGFGAWVETDCGMSTVSANQYMRVAHYAQVIPQGLMLKEAVEFLKGLPRLDGTKNVNQPYPKAVKDEARRLHREEGLTYVDIGIRLGVSKAAARRWCRGKDEQATAKERARRQKRLAKIAARELKRQEAERRARSRGGSISKAYSLLRQLAQELDRARADLDAEARSELGQALGRIHSAETHLARALGVEYGRMDPHWTRKAHGE